MTREKVEKIVRGITDKIECNTADIDDWAEFWGFTREEYEEYLDMALKALEKTDVPDTNVGDLISRQAVLNLFNKSDKYRWETSWIRRKIEKLPSVEPERKPGKWLHMDGWWECDQCHAEYTDMPTCMGEVMYKYCPMCGCRMKEVEE